MSESVTEVKEQQPNEIFFEDKGIKKEEKEKKFEKPKSDVNIEFTSKGSNRRLEEPYNIHFTIGSKVFQNLITFLNDINCDVLMWFKKKEMVFLVIDIGKTHASSIHFEKTEISDYNVKGLENENDELFAYVDVTVIVDKLSIDEKHPVDVYIDTLHNNRYYVICGKSLVRRQLQTEKISDNSIISTHKGMDITIGRLTNSKEYQKIVINQSPLSGLFKSLSKKTEKGKSTIASLKFDKNELNFEIEKDTESYSDVLSGQDMMVHPIDEGHVKFSTELFNKFGKVDSTFTTDLYLCSDKPIIFGSRIGGGKIIVYFLVAPRVETND